MSNFRIHITCIVLVFGFTETALAQDWALLNPAYRYNYSNDGTDTISNQIRVMHIDTLGVDSFRYELNKVAERCIGCSGGCNLRINLPQFLRRECNVGANEWHFNDTTEVVIRQLAQLGETWLFDPGSATTAVVSDVGEQAVFGAIDSVRTAITALNDTVRWSKDHGIMLWHLHDGPHYEMIGIQGPGVGKVIPSLEQFYRYQPGDVVQFGYSSTYYNHSTSSRDRFHIEQRTELPGRLEFTGYSYGRFVGQYGAISYTSSPTRSWVIDITSGTGPLVSAPDELVTLGSTFISSGAHSMICKHRINENGYYVIQSESFGSTSMFYLPTDLSGECVSAFMPVGFPSSYILDNELGLRYYGNGDGFDCSNSFIWGAVIGGDTIGIVNDDAYFGLVIDEPVTEELVIEEIGLCPNPAMDWVHLPGNFIGKELLIFDPQGRVVRNLRPVDSVVPLDVRSLPEGIYLLKVDGADPQRLVIAR